MIHDRPDVDRSSYREPLRDIDRESCHGLFRARFYVRFARNAGNRVSGLDSHWCHGKRLQERNKGVRDARSTEPPPIAISGSSRSRKLDRSSARSRRGNARRSDTPLIVVFVARTRLRKWFTEAVRVSPSYRFACDPLDPELGESARDCWQYERGEKSAWVTGTKLSQIWFWRF